LLFIISDFLVVVSDRRERGKSIPAIAKPAQPAVAIACNLGGIKRDCRAVTLSRDGSQ